MCGVVTTSTRYVRATSGEPRQSTASIGNVNGSNKDDKNTREGNQNVMVRFDDEPDLQRKIAVLLNKNGYQFKKTKANSFCDIIDDVHMIYVEVKPETFAPAQILYGLARDNIKNARYVGLACAYEVRFYKCPSFNLLLDFARSIDPNLGKPPSSINKAEYTGKAFELLGFHHCIWDYRGEFKIEDNNREIFLNDNNYEYFKMLFTKYNINPAQFLNFLAFVESEGSDLKINKEGKIYESKHFNIFKNQQNGYHDKKSRQKTLDGDTVYGEQDIRPVKDKRDRDLFESLRVKGADIEKIIHKMDELTPLKIRRQIGKFFSGMDLGEYLARVISELVKPDFVVEPMVGGGSLIAPFVGKVPCVVNDINKGHVDLLKQKYGDQIGGYFSQDFILTPTSEIIEKWGIPREGNVLIYTNPPFGTVSTNNLASKKGENEKGSRETKIDYAELGDMYGRGDLCIPSIGRMIEIIKARRNGFLAFFSPVDVFMGRNRYIKLFKSILKDFKFVYAEIFSGNKFSGVAAIKPICISIWQYDKGIETKIDEVAFIFNGKGYKLKVASLMKDGWKYDTRVFIKGEIATQGNERFNCPTGKMISTMVEKGGSEMVPENVIIDLHVTNVPSELIYGLWSRTVGRGGGAIVNPNFIFNGCYVHLPDFRKRESIEILTYSVLYTLITEIKHNYCQGKLGFSGMQRVFRFGGKRLTDGAMYLIDTHGDCPVGSRTIKQAFDELKAGKDPDAIDKNLRIDIRREVEKRLDQIGYWDYLPIPDIHTEKGDDDKTSNVKQE